MVVLILADSDDSGSGYWSCSNGSLVPSSDTTRNHLRDAKPVCYLGEDMIIIIIIIYAVTAL